MIASARYHGLAFSDVSCFRYRFSQERPRRVSRGVYGDLGSSCASVYCSSLVEAVRGLGPPPFVMRTRLCIGPFMSDPLLSYINKALYQTQYHAIFRVNHPQISEETEVVDAASVLSCAELRTFLPPSNAFFTLPALLSSLLPKVAHSSQTQAEANKILGCVDYGVALLSSQATRPLSASRPPPPDQKP